jgi:PAS domain S-box-containing protein
MGNDLKPGQGGYDEIVQKQHEAELKRLETAINQVAEAIVMTDVDGTIVYVNPAFEKITGYSPGEAMGQNPRILKSGLMDADFYRSMWETLTAGKTWTGRLNNKRKDGTIYTEDATISPVSDETGRTVNYVAVKRDITHVIELEKRLKQAEKTQAIGVLAGGIAHDFNNILFPIIGFAELLMDDLKDEAGKREKAVEIYNGARRAADLVQQILAISLQTRPECRPVGVHQLIRDVLLLGRSAIPASVSIETDLRLDNAVIMAEPDHLHQMIMNLITNAFQSLESGPASTIRLGVMERVVSEADRPSPVLEDGRYGAITVTDSGCGIAPEVMDRIFEPYFTTRALDKGTGLGLSIAQGLAREYGGDVTARSVVGQGSSFTLYLPLVEPSVEPVSTAVVERTAGQERILLVDDESAIVRMETIILERLGYRVSGHTHGRSALAAYRAEPGGYDLVISDMAMPEMTGVQLAKEILALRPEQPILICTGFSDQVNRETLGETGIRGLLTKPLTSSELAREIRRILDEALRRRIRGRILVIDDEAPVRHLFREKLAGPDCQVLEAADGAEGLILCRREKPDLVITDLIMPEKEGIETIMELRRTHPNLPVIAISGGGRSTHPEPYLSLAERLGARQVFAKPIDWQRFYRAVAELLEGQGE